MLTECRPSNRMFCTRCVFLTLEQFLERSRTDQQRSIRPCEHAWTECFGSYLELNPMYDPHLFEECRLATLARAEQQQLNLPAKRLTILLQHPVDLLALVTLLDLLWAEFKTQAARPR